MTPEREEEIRLHLKKDRFAERAMIVDLLAEIDRLRLFKVLHKGKIIEVDALHERYPTLEAVVRDHIKAEEKYRNLLHASKHGADWELFVDAREASSKAYDELRTHLEGK